MLFPTLLASLLAVHPIPALAALHRSAPDCRHLPAPPANAAQANDNQSRAGIMRDGVLTVRLVAHNAAWRPEGPGGCALSVRAFAEEGRATQIPGPLIRVTSGTEVQVTLRNELNTALWVRGFQDRVAGVLDSVEVAPGAVREFRFVPKEVGAWYYWAGDVAARIPASNANGQLVGALVVDPPASAGGKPTIDRVMVLTRWTPNASPGNAGFQVNAINGLSWPNSERLTYTAGDSVFWKLINASDGTHEMHLHGFFFRITGRGFVQRESVPPPQGPQMRVTSVMRPTEWVAIAWQPERSGNWLFHCHILTHMSAAQRLERMPGAVAAASPRQHSSGAESNHAHDEMGGLVMGVEVLPPRGVKADTAVTPHRRALDLYVNTRAGVFGKEYGYGFILQEGPQAPARDSIRIPGSPLILTKGEPVRIAVHNRLDFPISVHWHGMELESYFDGVGDFSGAAKRISPMVAPRDSFVVRFTPPRTGTFMYHVHGETGEQLAAGLYAPMLVVERAEAFDSRADRVFTLADGGPGDSARIAVNGSVTPDTVELAAGTTYRLRFIYILSNDVIMTTLSDDKGPVETGLIALDAWEAPENRLLRPRLNFPTGPGHTRDHLFRPVAGGTYRITFVRTLGGATFGPPTTVPIRVVPAR